MGFNRRKMEDQRRQAAEKEAATRRATDAQVLEDAERLIAAWNERQAKRMPMLFSPTIGAAITAGYWFLWVRCPACRTVNAIDLRTLDRHRDAAVTSLPPQVLVTSDPTGVDLKSTDWLIRRNAIAILPSVYSLKVLRGKNAKVAAAKPLIGFGDPVFQRGGTAIGARIASNRGYASFYRAGTADLEVLAKALPPLPETADELRAVAKSLGAGEADLRLRSAATVTSVKQTKLDQYRIVYFATHALVSGETEQAAKGLAEPALVLSLPVTATAFDDGLLTSSDVAQLKLNADWVVLSACNTAAADKPGAEALSGLARAFFYAGARALLVSHWAVESEPAVKLMTTMFANIAANPKLATAEALRQAMLSTMNDRTKPEWANPSAWAPFVLIGEGSAMTR